MIPKVTSLRLPCVVDALNLQINVLDECVGRLQHRLSPESSYKISQALANAKSSDPPKVATSKVISFLARNNGNDSYLTTSRLPN